MATTREVTPLKPDELNQVRERCAKLPVHDWLPRLLANYDREKMESDLLREDRADLRRL